MRMLETPILSTALLMLLPVLMSSCAHKPIECPSTETTIEVLFEWDNVRQPEVDGMTIFFYPTDGKGRIWRYDVSGSEGGPVEIPSGTYRMIACNNDVPGIALEDTGNSSAIRAVATRRIGDGVYAGNGMLYSAVVDRLEVTPCGVRYTTSDGTMKECGKRFVRCRPDSFATCYTIALSNVTGLENVRGVSSVLTPVSSGVFLGNGLCTDSNGSLYMPLAIDRREKSLVGMSCAFGTDREDFSAYNMSVRIDTADGKILERTIELCPDNVNIVSPHNVIIIIRDFNIPGGTPSGDVGGFDAAVDGWNVVEIELESGI